MTLETPAGPAGDATAPRRALAVMAHPDDIEGTSGGTIASLTEAGWHVAYCLVTSGDKGTKDPTLPGRDLAAIREAEQEAAARVLGVARCHFLHWPDGHVEDTIALRDAIVRVIRVERPDLVITWDGYRGFNHRDHRTVGIVTLDAVFPLARSPLYFPHHIDAGLALQRVNQVLLAGSREPDYFVDIAAHLERKMEALRCHASQTGGRGAEEQRERFRRMREAAAARGQVPWAEGFRRLFFGGQSAPNRRAALAAEAKAQATVEGGSGE